MTHVTKNPFIFDDEELFPESFYPMEGAKKAVKKRADWGATIDYNFWANIAVKGSISSLVSSS
jgi:hypothetical protein